MTDRVRLTDVVHGGIGQDFRQGIHLITCQPHITLTISSKDAEFSYIAAIVTRWVCDAFVNIPCRGLHAEWARWQSSPRASCPRTGPTQTVIHQAKNSNQDIERSPGGAFMCHPRCEMIPSPTKTPRSQHAYLHRSWLEGELASGLITVGFILHHEIRTY